MELRKAATYWRLWGITCLLGGLLGPPPPAWSQFSCTGGQVCSSTGNVDAVTLLSIAPLQSSLQYTNNGTIGLGLAESIGVALSTGSSPYNTVSYLAAPPVTVTNNGSVLGSGFLGAVSVGAGGITGGSNDNTGTAPNNNYMGRNGGTVTVTNAGIVTTSVAGLTPIPGLGGLPVPLASAIFAESIGGQGNADSSNRSSNGPGGFGNTVTVTTTTPSAINLSGTDAAGILAISAGGQGPGYSHLSTHNFDSGGNAGNVFVTHAGTITGTASGEIGIYALSAGGASGATDDQYSLRGGNAGTTTVRLTGTSAIKMSGDYSIGLFAGSAGGLSWYADNGVSAGHQNGNGGSVSVTADAGSSITTNGELAVGIGALSNGGNANTSEAPPNSLECSTCTNAIPTTRAPAGNAGNVQVTSGATITTTGDSAIGIVAVSSTGGRGFGLVQNSSVDQVGPGSGAPGTVNVTNSGKISTTGFGAAGILALSLGGPGGVVDTRNGFLNWNGGDSNNAGASAQAVDVANNGSITTRGGFAWGISAQSIGGGGGTASGSGGIFAVGSNGGPGGNGGNASVEAGPGSVISTSGNGGIGIAAESVGGGGGSGGSATGVIVAVGGKAGVAGRGGSVLAVLDGGSSTTTTGYFAPGVFAQSVGGGGGIGGDSKTYGEGSPFSAAIGGAGGAGGDGGSVAFNASRLSSVTTTGDRSYGVVVQSVGGGGGSGGAAKEQNVSLIAAGVAVGGSGGAAGTGGTVSASNAATVATQGLDADGIFAQSVGGGGGTGGSATGKSTAALSSAVGLPAIAINTTVGGSGGAGGSGGSVTLDNQGQITTLGAGAVGLSAQSVGGGGGSGGDSSAASSGMGLTTPAITLSVAIGGSGAGGGNGGLVTVTNGKTTPGTISTLGSYATGIFAQSVGGGGGDGGAGNATTSAGLSAAGEGSYAANFSLGGKGGIAAAGGQVSVTNYAASSVTTTGSGAIGIQAQSIGGGGGNAGGGSSAGQNNTITVNVGVGGSGGAAGNGGAVSVTNAGRISTGTTLSLGSGVAPLTLGGGGVGIMAQSIGGGGGNGGSSDASAALGEALSNSITAAQQDKTFANIFQAIQQSAAALVGTIAGVVQLASGDAPKKNFSANVSVGGNSGATGNGGSVTVANSGTVTTAGDYAHAIEAESIGGGGGSGGAATLATGGAFSATASVGGAGGAGGNGGAVNATNSGTLATSGFNAHGLFAQSIGGGGGSGALATTNGGWANSNFRPTISLGANWDGTSGAGGNGGSVSIDTGSGTIFTTGDQSYGVLAQSIGGGGGTASAGASATAGFSSVQAALPGAFAVTLGGKISSPGIGGPVSVTAGAITTSGNDAYGVLAQSISGGGGVAALASAPGASGLDLAVGGGAGASGNGGTVNVTQNGSIATGGLRSFGIVAQSIGGGGGIATNLANNIASTALQNSPGQNTAKGGDVTVTLAASGSIATSGDGAWGIVAQSIGGGGGLIGDPALALATPVSNTLADTTLSKNTSSLAPDSGKVSVTVGGNIRTTGANAHGVVAQAVGGGGGIAAGCCGSSSAVVVMGNSAAIYNNLATPIYAGEGLPVTVNQTGGTIATSGPGSIAIIAQSSGKSDYTQPIAITIGGSVIGGTGSNAAGILVSGGVKSGSIAPQSANQVTIVSGGSLGTTDGVSGMAITANSGVTDVTNNGSITGSINLGSTPGAITNAGLFTTGTTVVTSQLTNSGAMAIGTQGRRPPQTTSLTGNFVQTGTGKLAVTIDSSNAAGSLLQVSGTASVGGLVVPTAISLLPGSTVVVTAASLSASATAQSSLLFNWSLNASNTALSLSPSANFTPAGVTLTKNEAALAGYLTTAWNNADPALADLFGSLAGITSASQLQSVLATASALATQAQSTALANSAGTILGASMSCPVFVSQGTLLGEDNCVWAKVTGRQDNSWSTSDTAASQVASASYRLGGQHEIAPDWYLGGSLAAGQTWSQASGGSSGHGQVFDGSIALKHTMGPWLVAGSIALGNGAFHSNRVLNLPGTNAVLTSDPNTFLAGGRVRVAYEFTFADWYIRPYGDLDLIHTNNSAFREAGSSIYALNVHGSSKTNVAISPMVEFGGRYVLDDTLTLRPYAAIGVTVIPDNTRSFDASFIGASDRNGTFQTVVKSPGALGDFEVGLQVYRSGGLEVKGEYAIKVGGSFLSQSGSARVAYHF